MPDLDAAIAAAAEGAGTTYGGWLAATARKEFLLRDGLAGWAELERADGPITDGPITDGPITDGPITDGPITDGPITDGPITDGPITDGPITDGPITDGEAAEAEAWVAAILGRANRRWA